jgi:hypothetical protein
VTHIILSTTHMLCSNRLGLKAVASYRRDDRVNTIRYKVITHYKSSYFTVHILNISAWMVDL